MGYGKSRSSVQSGMSVFRKERISNCCSLKCPFRIENPRSCILQGGKDGVSNAKIIEPW